MKDFILGLILTLVILLLVSNIALAWQSYRHTEKLKRHDRCAHMFARRISSKNNENNDKISNNIEEDVAGILSEVRSFTKFCQYSCWVIIPFCLIVSLIHLPVLFPRIINKAVDSAGQSGYAHLGVDYLGLIVAIFAVLVTLLVTWQIYSTIRAREELREFVDKFEGRLKGIEECCSQGSTRMTQIEKDIKNSQKRLISKISSEVYHTVMGFDSIKKANYEQIIQRLFNGYENTFSDSLKRLALQQLAILFSANADRKEYQDLIEAVTTAVDKQQVNNVANDLFDGTKLRDETLEISNPAKTLKLINDILKAYDKTSK